jgi:hypothetical protein
MSSEELRKSIEKEAKRRLEEHLDQLRLEFEKMRLESHRKWEEFLMRLDFPLPELIPPGSIPEPAPPPRAPASPAGFSDFRATLRAIDAAGNQVDALKAFLSACVTRSDRAILLVSRGDAFAVWKAEGFSPSDESALRSVSVSPATHASLARAIEGTPITLPAESPVYAHLSVSGARSGMLCPIVVREKISAVLYADRTSEGTAFDPDAIALLCFFIGVAVDRLVTRKIHPSPALEPIETAGGEPAWSAGGEPAWTEAAPAAAPDLETYPEPAAPPPAAGIEVQEVSEAVEMEAEPEAAEPEPAPEPPPPPPARGIDFDTTGHPYRPSAAVVPPPGLRVLRGPLAAVEEDPHDHARKIARLLVSDIRLYNEAEIEEGKRHRNIYARLRDDIDRARQTYNDRVPESVRANTNYFHEELIRSLADGSADALGS